MLTTALVLLNAEVGVVKLAIGRLGPRFTTHPRAVFEGGDIFPSGHTSNAVVIFGVIGIGTVFLDTHWVTDVLGGWLAGILVLLALPTVTTRVERWLAMMRMPYAQRARTAAGTRRRLQEPRETG